MIPQPPFLQTKDPQVPEPVLLRLAPQESPPASMLFSAHPPAPQHPSWNLLKSLEVSWNPISLSTQILLLWVIQVLPSSSCLSQTQHNPQLLAAQPRSEASLDGSAWAAGAVRIFWSSNTTLRYLLQGQTLNHHLPTPKGRLRWGEAHQSSLYSGLIMQLVKSQPFD